MESSKTKGSKSKGNNIQLYEFVNTDMEKLYTLFNQL